MATMNISLPDEMKAFIDGQVQTGRFSNASDYVRDVIRDKIWMAERSGMPWTAQSLTAALEASETSGISERTAQEIFEATMSDLS